MECEKPGDSCSHCSAIGRSMHIFSRWSTRCCVVLASDCAPKAKCPRGKPLNRHFASMQCRLRFFATVARAWRRASKSSNAEKHASNDDLPDKAASKRATKREEPLSGSSAEKILSSGDSRSALRCVAEPWRYAPAPSGLGVFQSAESSARGSILLSSPPAAFRRRK